MTDHYMTHHMALCDFAANLPEDLEEIIALAELRQTPQ